MHLTARLVDLFYALLLWLVVLSLLVTHCKEKQNEKDESDYLDGLLPVRDPINTEREQTRAMAHT